MRQIFTAEGDLIDLGDELLPDEEVTTKVRELMDKDSNLTFTAAKTRVLTRDPKLAARYMEQHS